MKWLVVAVCLLQVAQFTIANGVPVFVWGDTDYKSAPVLSTDATSNLDAVLADESAKVIFIDSQLSTDDFNYCSLDGQSCFSFLGRQSSKFYSPSIESPLAYLRKRVWNGAVKSVNADEDFSVNEGETVFVHFRKGGHATHNDRLAAHDSEIQRIVDRLGDKGITYVYTAIENQEVHQRVARQARQDVPVFVSQGQNHVVRIVQVASILENGQRTNLTLGALTFTKGSDPTMATLEFAGNNLKMDVIQAGGRWWVENLVFEGNNYTSGDVIGANERFSYSCSPAITYQAPPIAPATISRRLIITGIQLEVDLNREASTEQMVFSENWNCVGFTSPGIWGGLFVTILLLFILSIGISWMLDINTMDRFDDPKGKTIIINASD